MIGLGDVIERALSLIGVTKDRVEKWVGGPCGCEIRKQRMNSLGSWAIRVLSGKKERAETYLNGIIGNGGTQESLSNRGS
jgi:hypothetical protein